MSIAISRSPCSRTSIRCVEFADRLPSVNAFIADAVAGDLRRVTPEESRPGEDELHRGVPSGRESVGDGTGHESWAVRAAPHRPRPKKSGSVGSTRSDRAVRLMNPGAYGFMAEYMGDERPKAIRLCNDFMADRLEGHTDRMMPVSLIDWNDLDGAVNELERMRARGEHARSGCAPSRSTACPPRIPTGTGCGPQQRRWGWWRSCTSGTRRPHSPAAGAMSVGSSRTAPDSSASSATRTACGTKLPR